MGKLPPIISIFNMFDVMKTIPKTNEGRGVLWVASLINFPDHMCQKLQVSLTRPPISWSLSPLKWQFPDTLPSYLPSVWKQSSYDSSKYNALNLSSSCLFNTIHCHPYQFVTICLFFIFFNQFSNNDSKISTALSLYQRTGHITVMPFLYSFCMK